MPRSSRLWLALILAGTATSTAAAQPRFTVPDGEIARDPSGAKLYVVDLDGATLASYATAFTPSDAFAAYHAGQAVNLVKDLAGQYGFVVRGMTSVTRLSFTAALTAAQITALQADPRVTEVFPNTLLHPSTPPGDTTAVWRDSASTTAEPPYSQWKLVIPTPPPLVPWGVRAVNAGAPAVVAGGPVVYVLDAGVGQHAGLTSVVERVNGVVPTDNDCGPRVPFHSTCSPAQLANVVGCYTHSTMVAGTIAATDAAGGTRGVYPGVSIVSVSIFRPDTGPHACLSGAESNAGDLAQALDWIGGNILATNHTGRPSVISLSYNWVDGNVPPGLTTQIAAVTHGSPGAFLVQSAGNFYKDACPSAYGPAATGDGVMVIGAINAHGQPVKPLNGLTGFWKDVAGVQHQPGSNFGSCVEAWAPGDAVLTTVGGLPTQQGTAVYSDYAYVSGTSLAAPHVAGLAAALIASDPALTTPALVEAGVRARLVTLGSHDNAGRAVQMPSLTPPEAKVLNTPYAEMWVSQRCYVPYFAPPAANCTFLREVATTDDRPGLVRDHATLFRLNGPAPLLSFDSKGEGSYSCDVVFADTGFESRVVADGGKRYYLRLEPSVLGSTLPGVVSSPRCPSAQLRLATD